MAEIKDKIFIHLPLCSFSEYMPEIAGHRINPEILITAEDLDGVDGEPYKAIEEIGRFLKEQKLFCTIHGPFLDLNPGSSDSRIRRISQERYRQVLALVSPLAPKVIVLHAAFDPLFYEDRADAWLERSTETWCSVVETAGKMYITDQVGIALENVLERTPEMIRKLLLKVNSPLLGMCFDIGHFQIFSQAPLSDWITTMGASIFELHLHDNHGQWDEHLALGEGKIDIQGLLKMVQDLKLSPALTIEAVNEEHALLGFQRLSSYLTSERVKR